MKIYRNDFFYELELNDLVFLLLKLEIFIEKDIKLV